MPNPLENIDDHTIPDWLKHPRHAVLGSRPYAAEQLSEEQADLLNEAAQSYSGHLNRVRPHKNEDGLKYAEELISSLHNETVSHSELAQRFGLAETPKKFSFELLLKDESVQFHWGLPDSIEQREFRQQVSGLYPNSEIKPVDEQFPEIDSGTYISGGKLELMNEKYRPIKALNGPDQFESDPYNGILSELVGYSNEVAVVQFVFTPAGKNWTDGERRHEWSADQIHDSLTFGRIRGSHFNPHLDDPSSKDKMAADAVLNQEGKQAYYVNIRYVVFAPSQQIAKQHAHGIGNIFSSLYHNNEVNQTFNPLAYRGDGLVELARRMTGREFHYDQTALTVEELAALAHHPGESVGSTNVDWTRKGVGNRPPAQADRTTKPPDMESQRDLSKVSGEASAISYLSNEPTEESDTVNESDGESDGLFWKGVGKLISFLYDDRTDDGTPSDGTQETETVKIDSPERQEAFNEVYRKFINGELTREQLKAQYNDNVADNLLQKFREQRAEEMGIDLNELEDEASVFDAPGARKTPDAEGREGDGQATEEPETTPDETAGEIEEANSDATDQRTAAAEDVETTSGLPDTPDETLPENTEEAALPVEDRRGKGNPAHHTHYEYDQSDTDVNLRREPGLQQYFPFELNAYASGEGYSEAGEIFSGFDVRDRLIHSHRSNPDEPIWLGYDTNPMDGIREIGLEEFSWFRHATVFGSTGKGKSTTLNLIMNQIARKDYGFVFIDPKGDTVDDLVTQLPEDRMDDIVWVEPGSENFDLVSGINFLEPGNCETEKEFDREVESIIDDLRAVLRGGEYWGPKMEGITCNIARAMIRSRRKFTLVDMYYVLADNESRAKFSNVVSQEGMNFIHEYTTKIAEMDEEEVDPILRRIQDWIEDPISRGIVAHRDGTINISDAVEEGKIILVRNTVRSDEIRKVVSTGVMRRVWSTIRKREKMPESEREPYFAIMDEFDDIASPNMALDKMLSKARSGKMGVITCLQNPSQVRDTAPQTLKQMFGNSDTLISFGVTEVDDARIIAERFDDDAIDKSTFMSLPAFTAMTAISVTDEDGPMRSDPLAPDTFAPYPPRRTKDEADDIIAENLQDYGVNPLEQDLDESEHALMHLGGEADLMKSFLEAVWAEQIRQNALDTLGPDYDTLDPVPALNIDPPEAEPSGAVGGGETLTVTIEEIAEGFKRRTGTGFLELPDGVMLDEDYVELVEAEDEDDDDSIRGSGGTPDGDIRLTETDTELSITDKGIRAVLEQADDDWRPETEKHNEVLRRAFVVLSAVGMEVTIVHQEHEEQLPDAVAFPPIDAEVETKRAAKLLEQFEKEAPVAADLSGGGAITIEAETSTYKKPARTLENLARSVRNDRRTMFITPEMEAEDRTAPAARVNHILRDPMFYRDHLRMRPNEDADDDVDLSQRDPMPLYYNKTDYLELGTPTDGERKHAVIERGKQAVWIKTEDDTLRLYDGMSGASRIGKLRLDEYFGSTNAFEAWCRFDDHNNEWVVYPGGEAQRYQTLGDLKDEWQLVYEPFVPEREFPDGEPPAEEEWNIAQTALPDFLSPADKGDDTEEAPPDDVDAEPDGEAEGLPEEEQPETQPEAEATPNGYDSIDDVPEEAAVIQSDEDEEETDEDSDVDAIRAGFTREAVPIPDFLRHEELPSNRGSVSGESVTGGKQFTTIPDSALTPMIPEEYLDEYRDLSALAIDGVNGDPVGINEPDETNSEGEDGQATGDSGEAHSTTESDEEIEVSDDPFSADDEGDGSTTDILGKDSDDDDDQTVEQADTELIADIEFSYAAAMTNLKDYYIENSEEIDEDSSPADIKIDTDAVEDRYGSKDPTSKTFWKTIWEDTNVEATKPIHRERLPGALQYKGIRGPQVGSAIQLGLASGAIQPAGNDGDTIKLPGPRDSPKDYLTEAEMQEAQDWANWNAVWNHQNFDRDTSISPRRVIFGAEVIFDFARPKARAALGAAIRAGVVVESGTELDLGDRGVPTFWQSVLDRLSNQPHSPHTEPEIHLLVQRVHDLDADDAEACIQLGLEHGVVYTEENPKRTYHVNTPRDDKGPDIAEAAFNPDTYPPEDDSGEDADPNTDDDDGDDDSGSPNEESDSETDPDTSDGDSGPATDAEDTDADTGGSEGSDGEPEEDTPEADSGQSDSAENAAPDEPSTGEDVAEGPDDAATSPDEEQTEPQTDTAPSEGENPTATDTGRSEEPGGSDTDTTSADVAGADQQDDATGNEGQVQPNSTLAEKDPEDLRLSPTPDLGAVQACLEESARFFHDQLDRTIDHNVEWNQDRAFEEGHRMPETPREYFTELDEEDPAYPVESDPDTGDAMPATKADQLSGVRPAEDAEDRVDDPSAFAEADQPYQFLGADHRGWSDDLVDEKQLGWAPAFGKELFNHLEAKGFEHHTMLATGLFTKPKDAYGENEDGEGYVDYTALDDSKEPADLSCLFRGRYIFPYYDEEGRVAFFIGRQPDFDTEHNNHPEDFTKGKYAKLASTKNYTIADEPIYGRETIRDGEPLVITEGMADAITAHAHGIPCISPVTKSFKMKHREVLADIIRDRQIPDVHFLQDSDPPKRVVLDEQDQDHDERRCERHMNIREMFCTGEFPGSNMFTAGLVVEAAADGTLEEKLENEGLSIAPPADPEKDAEQKTAITADEVPVHLLTTDFDRPRATGPISEAIEIHQYGPGVDSAVNMGRVLDTHTPSPAGTKNGAVQVAANVYEDLVINGDTDPAQPESTLSEELENRLESVEVETETEDGNTVAEEGASGEDGQTTFEVADDEGPDYPGTDVWLIELPQFGDEKRDLDDYLQNGWLALAPPADWALRLSRGAYRSPADDGGEGPATASEWMEALTRRESPVADYPTGIEPDGLLFPTANDLPLTVGAIPQPSLADDFPIRDPHIITSDPDADSAELRASHKWPVAEASQLRADGNALTPAPETGNVYPPFSLFGFLPTVHPSQHPAATGGLGGLLNDASESSMDVDPQEIEERTEEGDYRELTGKHNPLWNLDLTDLGLTPGSRGKNPFGHFGESENYFKVIDRESAYCHKRDALYNFQHFALCDMGERNPADSASGQNLDDYEYLLLWKYARENNLVPDHTPIPLKGLVGWAVKHDFCDPEDLEQFDSNEGGDGDDDGGGQSTIDKAGKRNLKLPDGTYFPVLKDIEEETGYTPARLKGSSKSSSGSGNSDEPSDRSPAVDAHSIALEKAIETYGGSLIGDKWPHPLEQFVNTFAEVEDEPVPDKNQCDVTPISDIRSAYNAWAQINLQEQYRNPEVSVEDTDLKTYSPGGFASKMKSNLSAELPSKKVLLEDGRRPRCWFGISLTEKGEQLIELEDKFELDE